MHFRRRKHRSAVLRGLPLCFVLLATLARADTAQALRNVKVGDKVPAFSVQGSDGKLLDQTAYKDKILLLLFVRPDQRHSVKALEIAQLLLNENKKSKLAVLAVSTKPDAADYFRDLAVKRHLTLPIATDPGRKMYGDYGLIVAPTTLLVDKAGILRFELPHMPPRFEYKLRLHIDLLLGKIDKERHDAMLADDGNAASRKKDAIQRQLSFAEVLIGQGKVDKAVSILAKLRMENEDSIDLAILLGSCYIETDNIEQAAKCLDPLAHRTPSPPGLKLVLARLERRRGDDEKAERYLVDALKTSPRKAALLYELGRIYEQRKDLDKAVECYRKALEEVLPSGVVVPASDP